LELLQELFPGGKKFQIPSDPQYFEGRPFKFDFLGILELQVVFVNDFCELS